MSAAASSRRGHWIRLSTGSGALVLGRLTAAACAFAQIPLVIGAVGTHAFGLWAVLFGVMWFTAGFDAGLGAVMQNRVAARFATGELDVAAGWLGWALRRLTSAAAVAGAAGFAIVTAAESFTTHPAVADPGTRAAIQVAIVMAAACLPLHLSVRAAHGLQDSWLPGLWTAIGSCVSLGATLVAVAMDAPLAVFVGTSGLSPLTLGAGGSVHLLIRHPWILRRHRKTRFEADTSPRECLLYLLPHLNGLVLIYLIPAAVALAEGAVAAGAFALLQRPYGLAQQLHAQALYPLWPAYARALATAEGKFAVTTYRWSMRLTLGCAAGLLLVTPFMPALIALWVGREAAAIPAALLWTVALLQTGQVLLQPMLMLLNGARRIERVAAATSGQVVVSFVLAAVAGRFWGATGVVLGFAGAIFLIALPLLHVGAKRLLGEFEAVPAHDASGKLN